MAHFGTELTPLGVRTAIGKFYQVQGILYIFIQLVHRLMSAQVIVLVLASQTHTEDRQWLGTYFLGEQEVLIEAQTVALVVVGIETVREGVLPAVLVQRTVLHRSHGVFPLVTGSQVGTLHNAATRETEHTRFQVGQCLCQILTHAVLMPLPGIYWEEGYMFQVYCLRAFQEDTQHSLLAIFCSLHGDGIFLPLAGIYGYFLLVKIHVSMSGAEQVHQFHPYFGRSAIGYTCPHRETVFFILLDTDAEETLIFQHGTLVRMSRVGQTYVVRVPVERTVLSNRYVSGAFPSLQSLWELKGTVLHQLGIETAVGCKVDVFKENAIHGRLNHGTRFLGIHNQFLGGFLC